MTTQVANTAQAKHPAMYNTVVLMPISIKVADLLAFADAQGCDVRTLADGVLTLIPRNPVGDDLNPEFVALPPMIGIKPSEVSKDVEQELANSSATGPVPCGCKKRATIVRSGA